MPYSSIVVRHAELAGTLCCPSWSVRTLVTTRTEPFAFTNVYSAMEVFLAQGEDTGERAAFICRALALI